MSKTFFADQSKLRGDKVSLTRYVGPEEPKRNEPRRCLQLSFHPDGAPFDVWFKHGYVCLTYGEVEVLRDQFTRFLKGVGDCDSEGTFDSPMYRAERRAALGVTDGVGDLDVTMIFELARLALADGDFFDYAAEELDVSDEEMTRVRDLLEEKLSD